MAVVFMLATVQAFFLVSLLIAKRDKSASDRILMVWLAGIGLHTLIYFLHFQYRLSIPLILNANAGFPFLQGPFLLAYVAAVVGIRDRIVSFDYLHLLPFAAYLVYVAATFGGNGLFSIAGSDRVVIVDIFSLSFFLTAALLISVPAYIAWTLIIVGRANLALRPGTLPRQFVWMGLLIVGLAVVWLFSLVSFLLSRHQAAPSHLVFWALTVFVYVMGYLGLTRTSVFSQPDIETLKETLQPKYQKSGLSSADAKNLYQRIVDHVEQEQAYLDGDFSLQSLASALHISTNHASQAINESEQRNFRDFLNRRRIDEACKRLKNRPETNLLALALDVGFNSKSSFNRAFRKFTGSTPSEYPGRD